MKLKPHWEGDDMVLDSADIIGAPEAINTVAASGATQTIPEVAVASISDITLTANCTFTFPTLTPGTSFTIILRQDGTGSRTATWPAAVKWPAATAPTLSTGANKVDIVSFLGVGSVWFGFSAGTDLR